MSVSYEFQAEVWKAEATGAWHFVTVPKDLSAQIRTLAGAMMNAFGSLRVTAHIGASSWKTSLFFDIKRNAFLLPVKAEVRRKEKILERAQTVVRVQIAL